MNKKFEFKPENGITFNKVEDVDDRTFEEDEIDKKENEVFNSVEDAEKIEFDEAKQKKEWTNFKLNTYKFFIKHKKSDIKHTSSILRDYKFDDFDFSKLSKKAKDFCEKSYEICLKKEFKDLTKKDLDFIYKYFKEKELKKTKAEKKEKNSSISARVFHIVQQEKYVNKENIECTFDKKHILKSIKSSKMIDNAKWAFIKHDKDVDENNEKKAEHWHVVFSMSQAMSIERVAKIFDIEQQYINVVRGKGGFSDVVTYLTHSSDKAQDEGKYLYKDSDVIASSVEWIHWRNRFKELTDKEFLADLILKVSKGFLQLTDIKNDYPLLYIENKKKFDNARDVFFDSLPIPRYRQNFYISGGSETGKDLLSRELARNLCSDMNLKNEEDIFFVVGAKGAGFKGYKGQPVLIWSDCRASDLINICGDRGSVFSVFDVIPTSKQMNVKFGEITLKNKFNIVNSVQEYTEFLKGLAGEYVDKNGIKHIAEDNKQSYRRFPFIINLRVNDFDFLMRLQEYFSDDELYKHDDYSIFLKQKNYLLNFVKQNDKKVSQERLREIGEIQCSGILDKTREKIPDFELNKFDYDDFDFSFIDFEKSINEDHEKIKSGEKCGEEGQDINVESFVDFVLKNDDKKNIDAINFGSDTINIDNLNFTDEEKQNLAYEFCNFLNFKKMQKEGLLENKE